MWVILGLLLKKKHGPQLPRSKPVHLASSVTRLARSVTRHFLGPHFRSCTPHMPQTQRKAKPGGTGVGAMLRAHWKASVEEEVEVRLSQVRAWS